MDADAHDSLSILTTSFVKKVGSLGEAVKLRSLERRYTDFPKQKSSFRNAIFKNSFLGSCFLSSIPFHIP